MSIHTDKLITDTTGIDVVLSVLESGHSVELPATGYSMFPTLRPGDRALVNPLPKGALPVIGSVIVCIAQGAGRRAQGKGQKAEGGRRKAQGSWRRAQGEEQKVQGEERSVLVMHRLVQIKKDDSGSFLLITRGDSMAESDLTWHQDQIIGMVESYTRNGSRCIIKSRIPHEIEYKINRVLLWFRIKTGCFVPLMRDSQ